jgi:LysM repeat protein
MRKKSGCWLYAIAAILIFMVFGALVFLYLDYATASAMPGSPQVSITSTYPEGVVSADQPVVVFGQARDSDGIAEVQLWVNGRMVASQTNPDPESNSVFDVSQSWVPTGAGNYLALLRALDSKGDAGQSDPVRIEAGERAYTYEVNEGDTVESIAEGLGTTPEDLQELNPGIGDAPLPGTGMDVPGFPPGDDGGGDTPRVDPPAPLPPPTGDETPAEPAVSPWWTYLPLPDNFACLFEPSLCSTSPGEDEPASPPGDVSAELYEDACKVLVTWQDRADNEIGFRVYRTTQGSRLPEMISVLRPAPGSGERLSYVDENMPNGRFSYAVSAYNANGEYWSAPSAWVAATCHVETGENVTLSVEALEMTVRDPFERLYCYVSLAGSPFERVPNGSTFIERESGSWNIAEHFSGENKRAVVVDSSGPLEIVAECLGWQGETLVNLGRFSRSHLPEEWDGRPLTAGPPDGGFNVTYRINPIDTGGYGSGGWAIVDPSFPPPYDLRAIEPWRRCSAFGGDVSCTDVHEPGLTWHYDLQAGWRHTFRVYVRTPDEIAPRLFYESFRGFTYAPQTTEDCNDTVYYYVSAVVGVDPATGESIESLPSEELEVGPHCSQLEITLLDLQVFSAPDGDPGTSLCWSDCDDSVEAYGWLKFNGHVLKWNNHEGCDSIDGCLAGPPFTSLSPGLHSWADMSFGSVRSYGYGRNVLRIPIDDGQDLKVSFDFWDHDDSSPDDLWCGWDIGRSSGIRTRQNLFTMEPRSLAEWFAIDQDVVVRPTTEWSTCEITFHIRAIP